MLLPVCGSVPPGVVPGAEEQAGDVSAGGPDQQVVCGGRGAPHVRQFQHQHDDNDDEVMILVIVMMMRMMLIIMIIMMIMMLNMLIIMMIMMIMLMIMMLMMMMMIMMLMMMMIMMIVMMIMLMMIMMIVMMMMTMLMLELSPLDSEVPLLLLTRPGELPTRATALYDETEVRLPERKWSFIPADKLRDNSISEL